MLNEESRRKIRELKLDELVDILDDQERRLDVYASMSFDDRLSLAINSHMPTAFNASSTRCQISFVGTPMFSGPKPTSSSTTWPMIWLSGF